MSEWIDVKVCLPKPYEKVLIIDVYGDLHIDWINKDERFNYNARAATHWTYLPEPPAGQTFITNELLTKICGTPINHLDFSNKLLSLLHQHGYYCIDDLIGKSEYEIRSIQGLGRTSWDELVDVLKPLGLYFNPTLRYCPDLEIVRQRKDCKSWRMHFKDMNYATTRIEDVIRDNSESENDAEQMVHNKEGRPLAYWYAPASYKSEEYCSNCHERTRSEGDDGEKYCINCGAEMIDEQSYRRMHDRGLC